MESIIENLYAYLKDKYGVKDTEEFDKHETITKSITVSIPGVRKNSKEHEWIIFIELGKEKEKSLIIGENHPCENTAWSRYIEILDYQSKNYSSPFLKFIYPLQFDKDSDLETARIFITIFEEYFK